MLIFRAWSTCDINYRFRVDFLLVLFLVLKSLNSSLAAQRIRTLAYKVEIEFYEVSHVTVSLRNALVLSSLMPY